MWRGSGSCRVIEACQQIRENVFVILAVKIGMIFLALCAM